MLGVDCLDDLFVRKAEDILLIFVLNLLCKKMRLVCRWCVGGLVVDGGLGRGLVAVWLVTMVIWLQGWHARCWFWCFGWWWCLCKVGTQGFGTEERERRWASRGVMEDERFFFFSFLP